MMALSPTDRSKLARVLGMLGSNHAGERDAAALAADRLVRGRGLDWSEVLGPEPRGAARFQTSPVPDHVGDLQACGQRLDLLTAWEVAFIASLSQQRRVSRRQREILAGMAAKVRAAGPRAG